MVEVKEHAPNAIDWQDWEPRTSPESCLIDVWNTLPGLDPSEISWVVRLLENPASKFALPGAVDLFGHDCMHIVLSRGLLNQDEAFVIGVTMGNDEKFNKLSDFVFQFTSCFLYPEPYKMTKQDMVAFKLGVQFGKQLTTKNCHQYKFKENQHKTLAEVRTDLGIKEEQLHQFFEKEIALISPESSVVSKRLTAHLKA